MKIKYYILTITLFSLCITDCIGQVKEFTMRMDSLCDSVLMAQIDNLISKSTPEMHRDSVWFFPVYFFTQGIGNMDSAKYVNYTFLDSLSPIVLRNGACPADIYVTDLSGKLKIIFERALDRKKSPLFTAYHGWKDEYGEEVQKKLLAKLLFDGVFDYVFVTDVPLYVKNGVEKGVHNCIRHNVFFCIKNESVYVLFEDHQLYTMDEFVKLYGTRYPYREP